MKMSRSNFVKHNECLLFRPGYGRWGIVVDGLIIYDEWCVRFAQADRRKRRRMLRDRAKLAEVFHVEVL